MSDFYIASFSLDEDHLCHYGRPGMKWGQHIFGKDPSGRYTAKKRAKMVKKYGEKGARLKEAKSVRNAYTTARYKDKKHIYDKNDYEEYTKAIGDIVKEGTTNYNIAKQISDINKKELRLYEAYQDADNKTHNYWVDTQNMIRDAVDSNKNLDKEWYRKRDKETQRLDTLTDKLYDSYCKVIDQRLELSREWTEDVFGTKPSDSFSAIEMQETGMNFITSLPDSFYKEFDEYLKKEVK